MNEKIENTCLKVVNDLLLITEKNERKLDVSIVGGALREMVLEKDEVSDIDLLVSLDSKLNMFSEYEEKRKYISSYEITSLNNYLNYEKKREYISNYEMTSLNNYLNYEKNQLLKIANQLKESGYEVKEYVFVDTSNESDNEVNRKQAEYETDKRLYGVLKIKHKSLNYNVDLLFTLGAHNFVQERFDFNICKIESFLVTDSKINNYQKGNWITNNIIKSNKFLTDIKNKEITYLEHDAPSESVRKSFEVHFPKIKKKYPDYKLKIEFYHEFNKEKVFCDILMQDVLLKRTEKQEIILKYAQKAIIELNLNKEIKVNNKKINKI